jgi:hypothetical protein
MKVPILLFAGESDSAGNGCCTIEKAREFAAASSSASHKHANKESEFAHYPSP